MNSPGASIIAIVEDERTIRETVAFALRREGYSVREFPDGLQAWEALEKDLPDLAILDILLPGLDGLELCRRLRRSSDRVPILFLSSKDEEFDRVLGLELGADDYLCKPFSVRELIARVRVLFRRVKLGTDSTPDEAEILTVGRLLLDLNRYQATIAGTLLPLTVTEFRVLLSLARRPGHVKTRAQLIEAGYPEDTFVSERTIDSHIKRLRQKISTVDPDFEGIQTVHGLGYRFRLPEL
jgi:DNA-binding response OmpR family regulator